MNHLPVQPSTARVKRRPHTNPIQRDHPLISPEEEIAFRQLARDSDRVQQKYYLMNLHKTPRTANISWIPKMVEMPTRVDRKKREVDINPIIPKPKMPEVQTDKKVMKVVAPAQTYEREFSHKIWSMVTRSNQRVRNAQYASIPAEKIQAILENPNDLPPAPTLTGNTTLRRSPISARQHSRLFSLTEISDPPLKEPFVGETTFNAVVHRDDPSRNGSQTARAPRPNFSDMDEAALRNLAGSPTMFRSMLWYRKQPTELRSRRLRNRLREEEEDWDASKMTTAAKFFSFKHMLRDDVRGLYTRAAKELERWENDRGRLYSKKRENLDFGIHVTWNKALNSMRRGIKEIVATEYLREQLENQLTYFRRFEENVRRKFNPLSRPCEDLLNRLYTLFDDEETKDRSLKQKRMIHLMESVPHEALLLDDVISVLYSLSYIFQVEEDEFVSLMKSRAGLVGMKFTHHSVAQDGGGDHTMSSWLAHVPIEMIGVETVLFVLKGHNDFPSTDSLNTWLRSLRPEVIAAATEAMGGTLAAQPKSMTPVPPLTLPR